MRSFAEIDRWPSVHRWVGVGLVFGLCSVLSWSALRWGGNLYAVAFVYFLPLALAGLLLGPLATGFLAAALALILCLNLFVGILPLGSAFLALAALGLNYAYFHRWTRERDLQEFALRKTGEEFDLALTDLRLSDEKVRAAHQVNRLKIQRYTALNELGRSLAMAYKTQDVVTLLIETISKTFMAPGGVYTLLLFDSSIGKSLHAVRYSVGTDMEIRLNRERLDPAEPFNAWIQNQSKTLFIADAQNDFRFQNYSSGSRIRSLVAAPLLAGAELLGLIRMESSQPGVFRQDDARLLSNFCDLGTVSLEHVALYKQTIELAITDGLTGLYVQRYYKERVREEVLRALEHSLPLTLMMIDVDDFKGYNDKYGHLVGDRVLKAVAQVLKDTVRTVDLVARYGGEEFSVLLLKTPWDGAKTVAERIRARTAEQEILAGQEATHITVSIGVAELTPDLETAEAFIDAADQALYQAKADGKDCVRLAQKRRGK